VIEMAETFSRVFEILTRVIAAIFLLAFFYEIIFGKGFDGMDKFVTGFVFAWSFNKLLPDSNDEKPRRKNFRRVM